MANILFVYRETENQGIEYLSSYLKQNGHNVDLLLESNFFNNKFLRLPILNDFFTEEDIVERIFNLRPKPDLIGFSVMTADYQWALSVSKRIKERDSDIPIIFGGVHPTLVPELTIQNESVDMVCVGEGEEAILELADAISSDKPDFDTSIESIWFKTKAGEIISNPVRCLSQELDKYPFPDHDLFARYIPYYGKYMGIITSRGCPYRCTYCSEEALKNIYPKGGRYIRRHSTDNVIEHLKFLKRKYSTRTIVFNDDVFTFDKNWLRRFLSRYRKEITLPFTCLTHPRILNQDDAYLLKDAGCSLVIIGVQTGSDDLRQRVLSRSEKNEDIIRFSKYCHKAKLNFSTNHIFSLPYETYHTVKESANLYNTIRPSTIDVYDLLYFPKAKIIDIAVSAGILKEDDAKYINEGKLSLYQARYYQGNTRTNYDKFGLFFSAIPLLPKSLVNWLIKKDWFKVFGRLPLFLMGFVKLTLSLKTRTAYYQLNFIKTTFWYMQKSLSRKLRREQVPVWK